MQFYKFALLNDAYVKKRYKNQLNFKRNFSF